MRDTVIALLLFAGTFFALVGLLRFDAGIYMRLSAASNSSTLVAT